MIDPRRLLVLQTFARTESVTAAAKELYLTPSAVSQQLALLESEVGHRITVRAGRGLRLTPAGRLLVDHARDISLRLRQAEADLAAHAAGLLGRLPVAGSPTVLSYLLAPAIRHLRAEFPQVEVSTVEADAHVGQGLLVHGDIEAAVTVEYQGDPVIEAPDIVRFPIHAERFTVLLPRDHALAEQRGAVDLADLASDSWIAPMMGEPSRPAVLQAFAAARFEANIVHLCADYSSVISLAAATGAVALVPELALAGRCLDEVVLRPAKGIVPVRQIVMLAREDNQEHRLVRALLAALRTVCARVQP